MVGITAFCRRGLNNKNLLLLHFQWRNQPAAHPCLTRTSMGSSLLLAPLNHRNHERSTNSSKELTGVKDKSALAFGENKNSLCYLGRKEYVLLDRFLATSTPKEL